MADKIKLVGIDVDGCLLSYKNIGSTFESSWDALGYAYGLKECWDERINEFYEKREYDLEWARKDIADLKNRKTAIAENFLYPLPYSKGVKEFVAASKGRLIRGLLTTSVDLVAEKAREELGLEFAFCNKLHRNNGCFTGLFDYNVPLWKKHERITDICRDYSISPDEICYVGDNENDLLVGRNVGLFVAFNPKKSIVADNAAYVIYDFRDMVRILGI